MATNTTNTFTNHTGNGTEVNFSISFSYILTSDIDVTVAGVTKTLGTHYTISGSTVTFTSGNVPANGAAIKFQRDTSISTKAVDFQDGSVLTEQDLDNNTNQVLFAQQEITGKLNGIEEGATADQTAAEIKTLIASSPLDSSHIGNDAVNGTKIADNSINSEHYVDGSIDTAHLADAQITAVKLQDGSVTDLKLSTNSVVEAKIVDGNVTRNKLSSNAVDSSKIADDSVTTAKIADTAVTEAKIGNGQITPAKLANNAVTNDKIQDPELKTLAGMQSGTASKLADSTALTSDIADLNQLDGMAKQTTITDDDTKFPTSGAVVDYVSGQLDDIGGFESIANELSFPNTQAPNGVSISIADAAGLVVNGSGVSTTGRTLNGTTVTINNIPSNFHSSTVASGVRFIVTSTGSGQIYNYHKATLAESDLVGLSGQINDFSERYRVGSTNPTSNNDAGDLFFNTSTGKLLVYNGTSGAWEEAQSIGNFFISTLSPAFDGTTTDFTITNAPANAQQILLIIEGVVQKPNSGTSTPTEGFALSGSTVKLAAAPATGASYHAVVMGSTVNIGVPSNNTVTSAILQNASVIEAKLGSSAVTTAKLANDAVTTAKIAQDAVTSNSIANDAVAQEHIATNAIVTDNIVNGNITNDKIAADAVNGSKIADDSIDSEHYVDGSIDTAHIADDAVTADKLANSINSAIAANTAKDLTALSASNLTSGTIPDARFPSTLPAISGANLTGVSSAGQARNLLINGEFLIDQRRDGQTYSCDPSGGNPVYGTVDRWQFKNYYGEAGRYDVSQSTDTPNGNFKKSLKIDITTAMGTPSGNNYSSFAQNIEAQNVSHLGYGTSDSKQVTLQFWIKSTKTGTATVGLQRDDNGRRCLLEYTINASNTWEFKTLTFPADTSGGEIPHDNGKGLRVDFVLFSSMHDNTTGWHNGSHFASKSSQVNLADSTSNDIYFAGIQLEEGATANDFAHEDIGTTMIKCQRYYQSLAKKDYVFFASGVAYGSGTAYGVANLATEMRASPSLESYGAVSAGSYVYRVLRGGTSVYDNDIGNMNNGGKMSLTVSVAPSGLTTGEAVMIGFHGAPSGYNARSRVAASSEL